MGYAFMANSVVAETPTPNRDQVEHWERYGAHWVAEVDRYDAMTAAFGDRMLEKAALQPAERVIDVGCGAGATAFESARHARPGGTVLGVDISPPMLALARERAKAAGADDVEFVRADAQVHDFGAGRWDTVVSRFGVMFFDDPVGAFANLARALRAGGRLAFAAWQGLEASEWIMAPGAPAAAHIGMPEGVEPNSPGPFGLADADRTVEILERAGYDRIAIDETTQPMRIGDDVDDALAFFESVPFVRDVVADAPPDRVAAALEAAREALVPYAGPEGVVMNDNRAWLVTARRP
ncbi:MAG: class I SAM-dependent methyltransferase [Acidimicrobiia bacterium]|nr:class I SAM-dependent methyltransferase [Acidimicrobiia bacterium]